MRRLPGGRVESDRVDNLEPLREAVAQAEIAGDAVPIKDVAEGVDLPPKDVVKQLDQIRSESALAPPAKSREGVLLAVGVAALTLGLVAAWIRNHPAPSLPGTHGPILPKPPDTPATKVFSTPRPVTQPDSLGGGFEPPETAQPPSGITIHVVANEGYLKRTGPQTVRPVKAILHQVEKESIIASTISLIGALPNAHGRSITSGKLSRDSAGSIFRLRPGKVHITFEGWPGTVEFWVSQPLTSDGRAHITSQVEHYLAESYASQEAALKVAVDPNQGLLLPPPGIRIEFAGRRLDTQDGPRLAFADIDEASIARRIELAVRNAFERDHRPPSGPWTVQSDVDRKAPIPPLSRVTISRREDSKSFDLPTGARWTSEDERIVRNNARAVAAKLMRELSDDGQIPNPPR